MKIKAYIDHDNSELITIGFNPDWARVKVKELELKGWSWIDEKDDRANPIGWKAVELEA
jgi:hypothetical protein